jgi:hypothetical protein
MDLPKELTEKFSELQNLRRLNRSDVLSALNLQEKGSSTDYVLPAMGIFGVGLAVGAALGIILAPRSGRATRRELGKKVDQVTERAKETMAQ